MAEYSRIAKGSFTSTGAAKAILLPFVPNIVEVWNYSVANSAPAANGVVSAYWDVSMGQGFALETGVYTTYGTTPAVAALVADTVVVNGISTFSAGQMLQYGAQIQISGITAASPAVVTTGSNHGYATGDVVIMTGLYQSATTGMPQISNIPFTITVTGATTFSIPWNASGGNYTALSGSPTGAFVKKVLYPYLYLPGDNIISAISTGTTTTITTAAAHNFVVGQEVAFRIPLQWGTFQLNSLPNSSTPGSPIYAYVISVTGYNSFVVNVNSTGYTAFNVNQTVASVPGLDYPQVLAVGDVNTGGVQISSGSQLYPSPSVTLASGISYSTINGPAIQGAFFNNSRQGFVVGAGAGTNLTSSVLVGANTNVIYWRAFLTDLSSP